MSTKRIDRYTCTRRWRAHLTVMRTVDGMACEQIDIIMSPSSDGPATLLR